MASLLNNGSQSHYPQCLFLRARAWLFLRALQSWRFRCIARGSQCTQRLDQPTALPSQYYTISASVLIFHNSSGTSGSTLGNAWKYWWGADTVILCKTQFDPESFDPTTENTRCRCEKAASAKRLANFYWEDRDDDFEFWFAQSALLRWASQAKSAAMRKEKVALVSYNGLIPALVMQHILQQLVGDAASEILMSLDKDIYDVYMRKRRKIQVD